MKKLINILIILTIFCFSITAWGKNCQQLNIVNDLRIIAEVTMAPAPFQELWDLVSKKGFVNQYGSKVLEWTKIINGQKIHWMIGIYEKNENIHKSLFIVKFDENGNMINAGFCYVCNSFYKLVVNPFVGLQKINIEAEEAKEIANNIYSDIKNQGFLVKNIPVKPGLDV